MESRSSQPTNVIRFPGARSSANTRHDQKSLMDAVYSAGSLTIRADDRVMKAMATRLTIFGFVVIDEIQGDGMGRRLRPSEAFQASTALPWRISKPSGRYRIDTDIPEADRDLFAALQA
ncbi:hypothetical protein IC232_13360 [Microvirga sp. BT688]|uniref:hypothetical protein n=1 Tax=Microvirga sp. TaxID=1873136 RepID=UPI001685B95D|nr:hypothetical protein [Microvirga sp.]MBD2747687.1 hypothetical protein [Microvirga sp.]